MEYETMGKLIQALRKENGLTQKQLADMLNITDKAVSKWERDVACPDTATLPKLAEILGVNVESLLNAKTESAVLEEPGGAMTETAGDANPDSSKYKTQLIQLLTKGIPGFVVGFVLMIVANITISMYSGFNISTIPFIFIAALLAGAWFASFPYGWSLINRFLGRWNLYGHILVVIFLFLVKCLLALWVGSIAYPIVLIYSIIKAQKTRKKVKQAQIIVIILLICYIIFAAGIFIYDSIVNSDDSTDTSQSTSATNGTHEIDLATLDEHQNEVDILCQTALTLCQENENADIGLGWDIGEPSQICGVFYMTAKDSNNPEYNTLEKIEIKNAVLVVTGYYVNFGGIPIEEWEVTVQVYPNFYLDKNNVLTYDIESEYTHSLRVAELSEVSEWLRSEYSEMILSELAIP